MFDRFKGFVQEANMRWRDVLYILIIGGLMMVAMYHVEHWACK